MLEGAYQKGQQNKEQIKQDFAQGKEQAQQEAQQKKDEVESQDRTPRPQPAATMAVDSGTTQVR
jgi:hypothetical protein